jgi:hypothetical protein
MPGLVQFSCPSCGGKLTDSDTLNQLVCVQCGNKYISKQEGNNISLLPQAVGDGAVVVGNGNIIVQVNPASSSKSQDETQIPPQIKAAAVEKVECPICGKLVQRDETFRCKHCQRQFICLTHQDRTTFLCTECNLILQSEKKIGIKTFFGKWLGIFSLLASFAVLIIAVIFVLISDPFIGALVLLIGSLSLVLGAISVILKRQLAGWLGIGVSIFSGAILMIKVIVESLLTQFS